MKVTIITAVYNGEETLEDTIQSILSQSYHDIEHIIVDGNSNDRSFKIAMRYKSERCKVISENDKGFYDALNKGIALAGGEVIGILNADDVYVDSNLIKTVAAHFANDAELSCIYGDLQYVAEKKGTQVMVSKWVASDFSPQKLKYGWMPPHPTLFLRRSVYEKVGVFDLRFHISSDYDFILRCFSRADFKCRYLPQSMIRMQLGGLSNRSWKNIAIKMIEDYSVMKKNKLPPITTLFFKNIRKWGQIRRVFW
jgi:glycosyltransferase